MNGDEEKTAVCERRIMHRVLSLLAVIILFAPIVGHFGSFFSLDYIPTTEKRLPNPIPALPNTYTELKNFPAKADAYLDDHFGFRSTLVATYNFCLTKLGASPSEKVTTGKNGWLYYTAADMVAQYRGENRFENDELSQWIQSMAARKEWLAEKGIPFIIVVAPNKMTIYPEYLPDWVTKVNEVTRFDQLMSELTMKPVLDLLDLRPVLLAEKNTRPVYYQTDSHWNYHGAFAGYCEILNRVKAYFPIVAGVAPQNVSLTFSPGKGRDLAQMLNISDLITEPYNDGYHLLFKSNVLSTTHFSDARYPMKVETRLKGLPRALIFRDSFSIPLEPFFNETFSEVLYVNRDRMRFDEVLIEKTKPNIVIYVIVERALPIMPHNPIGVRGPQLFITDWGPRSIKNGGSFNRHTNGKFAIWLNGENLSRDVVIVWDNNKLRTSVDLKREVVTALVPASFHKTVGKHVIYLLNTKTKETSNPVNFYVR